MTSILAALGVILVMNAPIAAGTSAAVTTIDEVTVTVDETPDPILLGDTLDLAIMVTNNGSVATGPLVLHIDITDLEAGGSVDPEDWTATLSKPIGQLASSESRRINWRLQPISGGSFTLYAVTLAAGADNLAPSNVITIDVTDQRSLNPNGILPVAIATPAAVGTLLIAQLRRSRRRHVEPISTI